MLTGDDGWAQEQPVLRRNSRERGHHEAEDRDEAQVDAGHVPPVLGALFKHIHNPRDSIWTSGVVPGRYFKGGVGEYDSVGPHILRARTEEKHN